MAGNTITAIVVAQTEPVTPGTALDGQPAAAGTVTAPVTDVVIPTTEGGHVVTQGVAAEKEVFPPFDPASFGTQLIWLALCFIVLYLVMSRLALPRIGGILETRRIRIEGDLKEAERLRVETERAAAAYEAALAEARRNAQGIAEETRSSIKADIGNKRASVEADLGHRMGEAEARIQASKTAALGNVAEIAAETAQALVERLAGNVTAEQARAAVAQITRE